MSFTWYPENILMVIGQIGARLLYFDREGNELLARRYLNPSTI